MDRVPYAPDTPTDKSSTPIAPQSSGGRVSYMDNLDYHKIANFFEISYEQRRDPNIAQKLSYLTDYVMESRKTKDHIGVLEELKRMTDELGLSDIGTTQIKKLYEFSRLEAKRRDIDREIALYKKDEPKKEETPKVKVDTDSIKRIVQKEMESASKSIKSTLKSQISKSIKKLEKPKEEPQPPQEPQYIAPY